MWLTSGPDSFKETLRGLKFGKFRKNFQRSGRCHDTKTSYSPVFVNLKKTSILIFLCYRLRKSVPQNFLNFFLKIFFFEIKIHLRSKTSKTLSKVKSLTKHKNTPFSIFHSYKNDQNLRFFLEFFQLLSRNSRFSKFLRFFTKFQVLGQPDEANRNGGFQTLFRKSVKFSIFF